MKKILSICFLWAFSLTLWGQSNGGYGGDFNPTNPGNPQEPSTIMKYKLMVTSGKGGYANCESSSNEFVAGTSVYLYANPNSGYKFKCWIQDGNIISSSQWYYYTMPAKNVEIQAVFAFEPVVPGNPDVIPLDYKVTVEASPSRGGNVYCSSGEVRVGEYTYVSASPYSGYKFNGWLLDGKLVSRESYYHFEMESRNMHFTALFEFDPDAPSNPNNNPGNEITYTLAYLIDGQVCYTEQVPAGATITTITTPTKKGYTFSGWLNVPTLMPNYNVAISGNFIVNKHWVTYLVEDKEIHTEEVAYNTVLTPPVVEEREGHTLIWKNLPSAMPDSSVVVKGNYSPNVYKLTYIIDGEVYRNVEVTYGDPVVIEQEPEKEGHTFSGWSEVPETMPAKDFLVVGTFSPNSYKVTYILEGTTYKTDSVTYGSVIVAPEVPIKEGMTFSGWSKLPETMPAYDVICEGSYLNNPYTIIYMVDGMEYHRMMVEHGAPIVLLDEPAKIGYTFSGWSEVPEMMPAENVTVNGTFTINRYAVTFTIDGKVIVADSLDYGTPIIAPEVAMKEGYTFSGWGEIPTSVPANDVAFAAWYTVNQYKLTFVIDGAVYKEDTLDYGSEIVAPEVPIKENMTFSGWSKLPDTMPAYDLVCEGSYLNNPYTIIYMLDGVEYHRTLVEMGSTIHAIEAPYKEGHTFMGWENMHDVMPGYDIVIYGSYHVNSYVVTFIVNGETYTTYWLEYGSTICPPETPERMGYTFAGWENLPDSVPAHDVTCEAMYTVNIYKIYYYVGEELVHIAEVPFGEVIPEYIYESIVEGDTFIGWMGEYHETMPPYDLYYTANIINGIGLLVPDKSHCVIYDLTGRRILDMENLKGVYIVNGKKVVF